ncbi:MAG: hypothetical protein WCP33_04285 [Deltaproteobacteria bacterium]
MKNVLLITDVPRLMKIFSRIADDAAFRLRIVNNLEIGGEEIVSNKPAIVFVQAHLSGFSADILIKHLRKQLGKKRSRFVLLATREQATAEAIARYHGHIDTSQDDISLTLAIRDWVDGRGAKGPPYEPAGEADTLSSQPQQSVVNYDHEFSYTSSHGAAEQAPVIPEADTGGGDNGRQFPVPLQQNETAAPLTMNAIPESKVDPLEEQGVTYSRKPRISVQSGFTNSFDNAVKDTEPPEPVSKSQTLQSRAWDYDEVEAFDPPKTRSKTAVFFLWLVPVLAIAIIVTIFQQKKSQPAPKVDPPKAKSSPAAPAAKQPATAVPVDSNKPVTPPPAGSNAPPVNQTAMPATPENSQKAATATSRLKELPDFVPRDGLDKSFGATNPGWERYKGHSTEFKIYREGEFIKAIQIIDRSGKGIPDSFTKGVLRQVSKNPVFTLGGSEIKEEYEILRGQLADNTKVVYYRDEKGGIIRAVLLTWP